MTERRPQGVYRRRRLAVALVGAAAVVLAFAAGRALVAGGDDGAAGERRPPAAAPGERARPAGPTTTSSTSTPPSTTTPTGTFTRAPGGTGVVGVGRPYRYAVEVEEGTGVDPTEFATAVDRILGDRRGWTTADGISLQRAEAGPVDFTVRLATPLSTDILCLPLDTHREVSCGHNAMAVINLTRWREGAAPSRLGLDEYRAYVVTHEVGHLIGHRHESCAGPGQRATTMMQQTYTIGDCTPNPWPAPDA